MKDTARPTNKLIHEDSLYLQQHAHNPVHWLPWSAEAFEKAKSENKLLIISIGYSSCHWCHVMEKECFENVAIAEVMNENFVCIKVDREERPDIDAVYMTAVQLMKGQGGWPLNCFTLPDGRAIYGGTYFNPQQWIQVLEQLSTMYQEDKSKFLEYASSLQEGMLQLEKTEITNIKPDFDILKNSITKWSSQFDKIYGGLQRAPKFAMPVNLNFLMQYGHVCNDTEVQKHIRLTLSKMYNGGIFDQLDGGFARYSTDNRWEIPHFEKMLYDNAQLISVYAQAYRAFNDITLKNAAEETLDFLNERMYDKRGFYYSAIDADSEGEEGKYYFWTKAEIRATINQLQLEDISKEKAFDIACCYFSIPDSKKENDEIVLQCNNTIFNDSSLGIIDSNQLKELIDKIKSALKMVRNKRIHPVCDKKLITSWNALMISALADAAINFNNKEYELQAITTFINLEQNLYSDKGQLLHSSGTKQNNNYHLEDYAFLIQACIKLFECTWDFKWIEKTIPLTNYAIQYFSHDDNVLFYDYTAHDTILKFRKTELQDNVIPCANSVMANNLFLLSKYLNKEDFLLRSKKMLEKVIEQIPNYGFGYANWVLLLQRINQPFYEVAFGGNSAFMNKNKLNEHYLPMKITAPIILKDKIEFTADKNVIDDLIYVCRNHSCLLPTSDISKVVEIITNQQ
ncbi:MAG: thioredoxin domain-containing protein [Bacteroidetes bacterium]|nr:thioredoxin domain-containing protein [Bacteroidota bacterium]